MERQWIATSLRYQGKWSCPSRTWSFSTASGRRGDHRRRPANASFHSLSVSRSLSPEFQHRTSMVHAGTGMVSGAADLPRRAVRRLEPKENRPMTVRWKPLLILSGLFLVVALIGVVAIILTAPRSSQSILKQARAARGNSRFEDA